MKWKFKLETRGGSGKRKTFCWCFNEQIGYLMIENEDGKTHRYAIDEMVSILNTIKSDFGDEFFPLANNVQKLGDGTEIRGLGTIILDQRPRDITHAQGSSYLGPVFEEIGYFRWNGKRRGIKWKLIDDKVDKIYVTQKMEKYQC